MIFGTILCDLNIGLMKCGRVQWKKAEEIRKDFNIVLIHHDKKFFISERAQQKSDHDVTMMLKKWLSAAETNRTLLCQRDSLTRDYLCSNAATSMRFGVTSARKPRAPSQEPSMRFGVRDPHENPGHRPNDRNPVTTVLSHRQCRPHEKNLRALQGHSGRNLIDPPSLQDNVLIPDDFFEYIYHIGCAINLHSIVNSGLIPGGQKLSKERQTVFFTAVNPMNKEHKDPYEIDLTKPRLASYKQ